MRRLRVLRVTTARRILPWQQSFHVQQEHSTPSPIRSLCQIVPAVQVGSTVASRGLVGPRVTVKQATSVPRALPAPRPPEVPMLIFAPLGFSARLVVLHHSLARPEHLTRQQGDRVKLNVQTVQGDIIVLITT